VVRDKIRYYRQNYLSRPDPITFMPGSLDTSDHIYDDFSCLPFSHVHREESDLGYELPEESDLSSRSFMQIPLCIRSRRPTRLLTPCLVLFTPSSD
jgi:hypothetical protein